MIGLLKNLYFLYCKGSVRGRERYILRFLDRRKLFIRSAVLILILYVLSQINPRYSSDSGFSVSEDRIPNHQPLVTVIVTIYNIEPFVQSAIRAVLSQTYINLEVILIDDASSDQSMEKAREASGEDQRVRYISLKENTVGGVGIPTNVALEEAKGKYVALVDGDDFPEVNFIAKMVNISLILDLDISFCRFRSFEDSFQSSKEEYDLQYWPRPELVSQSQSIALDPLEIPNIFRISPEPWRKLYKRKFLEENHIRFPEGDFTFEDNAFHWLVLRNAKRISFIGDELVWHRENRRGQTTELKRTFKQTDRSIVRNSEKYTAKITQRETYVLTRSYVARASHFMNIYSVGQDIKKCNPGIRYCMIARTEFLMWIYRYKWLVALIKSLEDQKTWRKFASIYFQTLTHWREQFKSSYLDIPARKRIIPEEISRAANSIEFSVVIYCRNIEVNLLSRKFSLEHVDESVEFIFLDDNSEDSTLERLSELKERFDRVHVIHMEGRGPGRGFNFAIPLCEGKYVTFLSFDTFTDSEVLSYMIQTAESYNQDLLVFKRSWPQDYGERSTYDRNWMKRYVNTSIGLNATRDIFKVVENSNSYRYSLTEDESIIPVVRRDLILQKSIFYGGIGIEDRLQFNWHVFLSAESVKVFQLRRKSGINDVASGLGISGTTRYYCPLKILNVLLTTNRVLINSGIAENKKYHSEWKRFCTIRIARGMQFFSNDTISRYNRFALLALTQIESHRSTMPQ